MAKRFTFDPALFGTQVEAVEPVKEEVVLQDYIGDEAERFEELLAHKVIVDSILGSKDTDLVALGETMKDSIFGETDVEEAEDFIYDGIAAISSMCAISDSLKDDLVSEDENIRMDALVEFRDILSDSMASVEMDSLTLSTIIASDVEMDDITFDETWYPNHAECKDGKPSHMICKLSHENGKKGERRVSKTGNPAKGDDKQSSKQKAHSKEMGKKPMTSDAKKKMVKSLTKTNKDKKKIKDKNAKTVRNIKRTVQKAFGGRKR